MDVIINDLLKELEQLKKEDEPKIKNTIEKQRKKKKEKKDKIKYLN